MTFSLSNRDVLNHLFRNCSYNNHYIVRSLLVYLHGKYHIKEMIKSLYKILIVKFNKLCKIRRGK